MKYSTINFLGVFICQTVLAQIPNGYYNNAAGLEGSTLKTALWNRIKNPTVTSYAGLYTAYQKTDKKPNGKVWCMYSDVPGGTPPYEYSFGQTCGSYRKEGDCFNREHSVPQSWFDSHSPMQSDLFHVYPTDGFVNGLRSNYPYGNVTNINKTTRNGGKLGTANATVNYGYTGTVFEVIDDYKGDFARTQLYMIICYEDRISTWASNGNAGSAMDGKSYPGYHNWYLNTMLEWHIKDPVSAKEIDRNNEAHKIQNNRNPLIDSPQYVQRIWFPEQKPIIQFTSATGSISEGNTGTKTYTMTISVPAKLSYATTVTLSADVSSTATLGTDYSFSPSSFTFNPSMSAQSQTITITINGDTNEEPDETAIIRIMSTTLGAPIGTTATHTLAIRNDDGSTTTPEPSVIEFVTISGSITEGDSGTKTYKIPVSISPAPTAVTTASVVIEPIGTTALPAHYTLATNTVNFSSTVLTDTVQLNMIGDTLDNPDRTIVIKITSPTNGAVLGANLFTLTIQDDDTPPVNNNDDNASIQFETDELTIQEGNETFTYRLPISIFPAPVGNVTVQIMTDFRFTSASTNDFELLTTSVSFSSTKLTDTVLVNILGNTIRENDRFVAFKVGSINGKAKAGDYGSIRITIQDDDNTPLSSYLDTAKIVWLVYPNPTSGLLYIDGAIADIQCLKIIDLVGNLVMNPTLQDNQLDVSNLTSGAYFLEIITSTENLRFKILKK